MLNAWILAVVIVAVLALVAGLKMRKPIASARREAALSQARQDFHRHRERLEAKFVKIASTSGRPRGLRWTECDFDDAVSYARDRGTGELSAFVAVTIAFEAIEGGPMEGVEAVGNLRAATAVFTRENHNWTTHGRVMFNLNPTEAIAFYQGLVVEVATEPSRTA